MKNELLLYYLRNFPVDYGKHLFEKKVTLPLNKNAVEYTSPTGIKYFLDLNDHVMRQIYLKGVYERNTLRHLLKLSQPDMTFVDVGANIGAYTLTMSNYLTKGRVISFEPNPRAIRFIKKNIEINNFNNVQLVESGLSDKVEEAILYTSSLTTASINKGKDSAEKEQITLTTLDLFCRQNGVNTIDLIKIDVEGHEVKCLEGASEIIDKSKRMVLIMEIDDNCKKVGIEKKDLFNSIIKKGFKGFIPKGFPFSMKEIKTLNENYTDNIIFIKGQ